MIKYFCDRCGAEISMIFAHKEYLISSKEKVMFCPPCRRAYKRAIEEAEKSFFDNANGGGEHD